MYTESVGGSAVPAGTGSKSNSSARRGHRFIRRLVMIPWCSQTRSSELAVAFSAATVVIDRWSSSVISNWFLSTRQQAAIYRHALVTTETRLPAKADPMDTLRQDAHLWSYSLLKKTSITWKWQLRPLIRLTYEYCISCCYLFNKSVIRNLCYLRTRCKSV